MQGSDDSINHSRSEVCADAVNSLQTEWYTQWVCAVVGIRNQLPLPTMRIRVSGFADVHLNLNKRTLTDWQKTVKRFWRKLKNSLKK